ncbi:MAG: sugar-binding protein [Verrucomicrobiota bacterium]|nr:sugar-binding protein [Verrucomicrobiota bacterium]
MKKLIILPLFFALGLQVSGSLPDASVTNTVAQAVRGTAVIDGQIDSAWDQATAYPIGVFVQSGKNDLLPPEGEADLSGTFKTLWDDTHLYILVEAMDSELPFVAGNSVELYTSTEYTRNYGAYGNSGYNGISDTQIKYQLNANPPTVVHGLYSYAGDTVPFEGTTVISKETVTGYIMEIALSWASLIHASPGITWDPDEGFFYGGPSEYTDRDYIGFEIMLQDNDNDDGLRDTKQAWCGGYEGRVGDFAWADTQVWGTLQLVKNGGTSCTVLGTVMTGDNFPSVGESFVYALGYESYLYTGYCPFVYDFKGNNWWYVYEGSTDPNGFFVYNFGDSTWYYMYYSYLLPISA